MARERPLLEVIALDAADAIAAERGGADRLELVRDMALAGLTPAPETFARVHERVALPIRVMLRANGGFGTTPAELDALCLEAARLRAAGASEFVFGFLHAGNALDRTATGALAAAVSPCPWTLHHAFDHAADARAAWDAALALPGLDGVLSGGGRGDLGSGLATLRARTPWQTERVRWLAGGGLTLAMIPALRAAGIDRFHAGRLARTGRCWDAPVDEEAMRRLRAALDAPLAAP